MKPSFVLGWALVISAVFAAGLAAQDCEACVGLADENGDRVGTACIGGQESGLRNCKVYAESGHVDECGGELDCGLVVALASDGIPAASVIACQPGRVRIVALWDAARGAWLAPDGVAESHAAQDETK